MWSISYLPFAYQQKGNKQRLCWWETQWSGIHLTNAGTHTCWEEEGLLDLCWPEKPHMESHLRPLHFTRTSLVLWQLFQALTLEKLHHSAPQLKVVSFWIHAIQCLTLKFTFSWAFFAAHIKGLKLKSKTFQRTHYQHKKIELFGLSQVSITRENNILGVVNTSLQSWIIANRWEREEGIPRWEKRTW